MTQVIYRNIFASPSESANLGGLTRSLADSPRCPNDSFVQSHLVERGFLDPCEWRRWTPWDRRGRPPRPAGIHTATTASSGADWIRKGPTDPRPRDGFGCCTGGAV